MTPPFGFSLSRKDIRNAALAYPQETDRGDLADFVVTDEASRAEFGTRTWTAENLKTLSGDGTNAKEECMLFAQFIIDNYAAPFPQIRPFTIKGPHPESTFAAPTWELLTEVDISDAIEVTIAHPGAGGFNGGEYFVEGLAYDIRPGPGMLDDSYPLITLGVDLSPASHWGVSPFPSPTT